jgi:hypothetical protein
LKGYDLATNVVTDQDKSDKGEKPSEDWRTVYEKIVPSNQSLTEALLEERLLDRKREERER